MTDLAARKKSGKDEELKKVQPKFSKEQITASKRFGDQRDLVDALLDDGKKYTMEEVDKLVNDYRKGKVK